MCLGPISKLGLTGSVADRFFKQGGPQATPGGGFGAFNLPLSGNLAGVPGSGVKLNKTGFRFGKFLKGFEKGGGLRAFEPQEPVGGDGSLPQVMNDAEDPGGPLMQSILAKLLMGQQSGPFSGYGGGGY